ncbi:hypothetical protein EYF80_051658 [Liparis tanakae]|uniref:Uncharacterized protein n=1 Tax=Liparis tanakae TaxID=230148 RepID=A0A4Z2FB52_9TELE|nr:hypothetical protein EYF80_051658 [Liparis tanakae]
MVSLWTEEGETERGRKRGRDVRVHEHLDSTGAQMKTSPFLLLHLWRVKSFTLDLRLSHNALLLNSQTDSHQGALFGSSSGYRSALRI